MSIRYTNDTKEDFSLFAPSQGQPKWLVLDPLDDPNHLLLCRGPVSFSSSQKTDSSTTTDSFLQLQQPFPGSLCCAVSLSHWHDPTRLNPADAACFFCVPFLVLAAIAFTSAAAPLPFPYGASVFGVCEHVGCLSQRPTQAFRLSCHQSHQPALRCRRLRFRLSVRTHMRVPLVLSPYPSFDGEDHLDPRASAFTHASQRPQPCVRFAGHHRCTSFQRRMNIALLSFYYPLCECACLSPLCLLLNVVGLPRLAFRCERNFKPDRRSSPCLAEAPANHHYLPHHYPHHTSLYIG
ncbi:hypothetical protein K437DRAFT_27204 [Tilletiaria anomala UBC 951]|uniref:Uncharacterized protein n=1 Tax=Tilletiaria anomala (strain ATCC 24038 / CBS 436.72 / UBC 951) TaxID=1037660 RepID=A0A066VA35_TILAU|nr:uncharacterized protein K437DRAFT_27204 [Tilletiaria anomala UBC 951]KDN38316.1 hypothetical protein K437DRAFT_27204 [Tilletiaria anomala UBC 951]